MNSTKLKQILHLHAEWLCGRSTGKQADLPGVDLTGADLSRAILCGANLSGANLSEANLSKAILCGANLCGANLSGANLSEANLSRTNLFRANLPYPIYQAQLGQYNMHTNAEYIRIGCFYETINYWLTVPQTKAEKLGLKKECYADYMAFIKWYANKYRNNPELFKGEVK